MELDDSSEYDLATVRNIKFWLLAAKWEETWFRAIFCVEFDLCGEDGDDL